VHIGIDLTGLWRCKTGIFRYAASISRALLARADGINYTLFYRKGEPPPAFALGSGARLVATPLRQERLAMQLWFPLARRRLGLDAIHYPAFPPPLLQRRGMVASIHDVTAWRYPRTMTWIGRHYWRPLLRHAAATARPVLVPSESTRADVIALAGADPEQVVVTPYAADAAFGQRPPEAIFAVVRRRYRLPDRYLLTVGTLEPRKNLVTLLRAMELLQRRASDKPTLVLVGREGWGPPDTVQRLQALGDAVRFTGHISDQELIVLYHGAALFIFPTLYEGFGLPVLEAFAAGCPVVSTTTSSIPEAAGDAALLVDPLDYLAMAEAISKVWNDPALAGRLRRLGRERSTQFTWERCAALTVDAYRSRLTER